MKSKLNLVVIERNPNLVVMLQSVDVSCTADFVVNLRETNR